MTGPATYSFEVTDAHIVSGRPVKGLHDGELPEQSNVMQKLLHKCVQPPAQWSLDLLRIARAAFLADKAALREPAEDKWTRSINLRVGLVDPGRWVPHTAALAELLSSLTSDTWHIDITAKANEHVPLFAAVPRYGAVALFSGGLDSTAYAAFLACSPGDRVGLVAHCQGTEPGVQRKVHAAILAAGAGVRQLDLVQYSQNLNLGPTGSRGGAAHNEPSSRTRGLLFMAAGTLLASGHGVTEVAVPENGQLAVNPPLTASRVGACSTRSVHPWTLYQLNRIIAAVGGDVTLVNPLVDRTKGEVCRLAADSGLPPEVLAATVSCGRAPDAYRRAPANCGCCFPCLIRRSGLHHALGGEDPTSYWRNPWQCGVPTNGQEDLIAVLHWLHARFGVCDLIADFPLPPGLDPGALLPVLRRGRAELGTMLAAKLPPDSPGRAALRRWTGG